MKCPKDQTELVRKLYENTVEIDFCESCQGIWLDPGELEKIEEVKVNDYSEEIKLMPDLVDKSIEMALAMSKPLINCPVCETQLERKEYAYCSQVIIDSCPEGHGIWLDKGELHDLEVFYERSRMEAHDARKGFFSSLIDMFRK